MNWRDHSGGSMPCNPDSMVRTRFRNGWITREMPARHLRWSHRNEVGDIMAFIVTKGPEMEMAA